MSDTMDLRAMRIFDEVCDLPPSERPEALERACNGDTHLLLLVRSMLARDAETVKSGGMATGAGLNALAAQIAIDDGAHPPTFGHYRVLREIGRGGMGVVYEAEQDDPKRRVALKVVRRELASAEVIKRFRRESQLLGRLDHPGIAQIFEAGTGGTDGSGPPYFAMEFIEGLPLDKLVAERVPSRPEVLRLFEQICDAVQHAHQKGVIHRDLKPANILVKAPDRDPRGGSFVHASTVSAETGGLRPKILDFGVARLADPDIDDPGPTIQTHAGQIVGTLAYMSPEQFGTDPGAVDARSDIYSVGVMLYQSLSGRMPHELRGAPLAEVARIVKEVEPKQLGTLDASLRGDLETIVATAMARDPERRYASASALSDDLRRYRLNEPISARPASALYQISKFAKRNRALVGGAAASVVILIAGVVGTTIGLVSALTANRALSVANTELDSVNQTLEERNEQLEVVAAYQEAQLGEIDPENMGNTLRAYLSQQVTDEDRDLFERSVSRANFTSAALQMLESDVFGQSQRAIDEGFDSQPLVQARLLQALAVSSGLLGLYDFAVPSARRAIEVRTNELGPDHDDTLASKVVLAALLVQLGQYHEAESTYTEAYEILLDRYGEDDPDVLAIQRSLAQLPSFRGDYATAETELRDVLERLKATVGVQHESTLSAMTNLANVLTTAARNDDAIPIFTELIEARASLHGEEHQKTLADKSSLATVLADTGRIEEAEALAREVVESTKRTLGDDHHVTLSALHDLGWALNAANKFAQAEAVYRDLIPRFARVKGPNHPSTLAAWNNLANALDMQGRLEEAEPIYRENVGRYEITYGTDHPTTIGAIGNLGFVLSAMGRNEEAEAYYRESYERSKTALGLENRRTLVSMGNLASLLVETGRIDEGLELHKLALETNRRVLGQDHPDTFIGIYRLGNTLRIQGRLDEAEPYCLEALARYESLSPTHIGTLHSLQLVARLRDNQDRLDEAADAYQVALDRQNQELGYEHQLTRRTAEELAFLLLFIDRPGDAEPIFRQLLTAHDSSGDSESPESAVLSSALAQALIDQSRIDEAEPLITEALARCEELIGSNDGRTISALRTMGALREAQERYADAVSLYERVLSWREANLDPDNDRITDSREDLERALAAVNR
ncbi:MAG: serine/threonine-protein kinase [Planctomycetota bacterium]